MQQNQLSLILLHVGRNRNSCFKENLKENLCVASFQKKELSSPKNKTFQEGIFRARKTSYISENLPSSKNFYISENFLPSSKNFLHFGKLSYISGSNLLSLKNKTLLYFFSHFLFVGRKRFNNKCKRKNSSYTFPYKEIKLSKLKYFLIIIIKSFFLIL